MPPVATAAIAGLVGGPAASVAMNLFQGATASLFGQGRGNADPATVKAADSAKRAVGGRSVTQKRRREAGSLVHYGTGITLGIGYALLALVWPTAAIGFGVGFGLVTAVVLDNLLVPALGWGPWPWRTPAATLAYGVASHVVFGAVLEGVRRLATGLL